MWQAADPEELLVRARLGDPHAFAALVAGERPGMVRAAWTVLGDVHEAEDAVQDALLRAFVHLDQIHTPAAFRAWLRRIAVNQAKNRLRTLAVRHAREAAPPDEAAWQRLLADLAVPADGTPHGRLESAAASAELRASLARLPTRQRQVIAAAGDGDGIEAIAAHLQMRPGAVRVALHRGRTALAAMLDRGHHPLCATTTKGGRPMTDGTVRVAGWRQAELFVRAYQEAHPDRPIAFVSDRQWDHGETDWDLCYTDLYGPIAETDRENLRPLPAAGTVLLTAHATSAHSVDGALWALPVVEHPQMLLFNPQMFAEAGVPAPTADWTWAECEEALRAFAARGRYGLSAGCGPAVAQWMAGQLGERLPRREALELALRMAHRWNTGPWVHPTTEGAWVRDSFYQNAAAMTVGVPGNPRWRLGFTERPCRLDAWDAVIPRFSPEDPLVADWTYSAFVFSGHTRCLDGALAFATWVSTHPAVAAAGWWGWPACTADGRLDAHRAGFPPLLRAQIAAARPWTGWGKSTRLSAPPTAAIVEAALRGERSPDDAATALMGA